MAEPSGSHGDGRPLGSSSPDSGEAPGERSSSPSPFPIDAQPGEHATEADAQSDIPMHDDSDASVSDNSMESEVSLNKHLDSEEVQSLKEALLEAMQSVKKGKLLLDQFVKQCVEQSDEQGVEQNVEKIIKKCIEQSVEQSAEQNVLRRAVHKAVHKALQSTVQSALQSAEQSEQSFLQSFLQRAPLLAEANWLTFKANLITNPAAEVYVTARYEAFLKEKGIVIQSERCHELLKSVVKKASLYLKKSTLTLEKDSESFDREVNEIAVDIDDDIVHGCTSIMNALKAESAETRELENKEEEETRDIPGLSRKRRANTSPQERTGGRSGGGNRRVKTEDSHG